jgi:hypothetical protein
MENTGMKILRLSDIAETIDHETLSWRSFYYAVHDIERVLVVLQPGDTIFPEYREERRREIERLTRAANVAENTLYPLLNSNPDAVAIVRFQTGYYQDMPRILFTDISGLPEVAPPTDLTKDLVTMAKKMHKELGFVEYLACGELSSYMTTLNREALDIKARNR